MDFFTLRDGGCDCVEKKRTAKKLLERGKKRRKVQKNEERKTTREKRMKKERERKRTRTSTLLAFGAAGAGRDGSEIFFGALPITSASSLLQPCLLRGRTINGHGESTGAPAAAGSQ
jgi:hypothetical protein